MTFLVMLAVWAMVIGVIVIPIMLIVGVLYAIIIVMDLIMGRL